MNFKSNIAATAEQSAEAVFAGLVASMEALSNAVIIPQILLARKQQQIPPLEYILEVAVKALREVQGYLSDESPYAPELERYFDEVTVPLIKAKWPNLRPWLRLM